MDDQFDNDERDEEIKHLARSHAELAISTLTEVMKDDLASAVAKVQAAKAVLDRGFGQPSRKIEQKVDVRVVDARAAHLTAMQGIARLPPPRPQKEIIDADFTEIEKGE